MRNFNAILFLFTGVLYLSACEAKCRGKNAAKLKRSLKLAISSDDINNRHKAGLRKIFRRKRDANDEEIESDIFTAEIKFLQKWNPAMSQKDGSAYRLFQGNVLDSILEQMNADRRFINSRVLDLKQTPDGILAKVGFHFRKSEHNPISHIRFVVSRGHVSSLKVDKNYFKIMKTPATLFKEHEDKKAQTQHQQTTNVENILKNNPSVAQQSNPNPATKQQENETPLTVSSQNKDQPKNLPNDIYQTQNQPSALTGNSNQPQNEAKPPASSQTQGSTQRQGNQQQIQSAQDNKQSPQSNDQRTSQVQKQQQQQQQAEDKVQNQNKDNAQDLDNQSTSAQPQSPYQTEATNTEYQNYPQDQNPAYLPEAQQSTSQSTQNIPYPSATAANGAQNQNGQLNDGKQNEQISPKPVENTSPQLLDSDEGDISIKMNQAWFPFLSNHDTPQYKMLAGNLEKGLKSVLEDDKNIKDIKVKDLSQADEGHTTVEFLLQFNGGQKDSTEKLRKIVKTGDIAGISVDSDFFEIKDNKKPAVSDNSQS
ncbi:uncharacterized protein LOC114521417 [Dendronephthya gigantea]|uniref:uncharacterized protein LOC114521417 n=1 Tax=Dendronephthya gigantea TaxID=151771 RepID=UPI00106A613B|nr:uncharacterized protein LOC114521417 [Dendronephthya gigantea]